MGALNGWLSSGSNHKGGSSSGDDSKGGLAAKGAVPRRSSSSTSSDDGGGGAGGGVSGSLWSPEIAAAMGYGKKGRAGSAFQWWILVLSACLAIGSFIAWAVLVFRARDTTEAALDALRVRISWWRDLKAILTATAVCFPILTLAAVAVSLWRASLAGALNIHAPDAQWMARSRAFQAANVVSSVLLYALLLLLMFSTGAMFVWAASARTAHIGSYYALKYVDPIWNGTASVVDASTGLVRNFVGLTQALPGVGRRLQGAPGGGEADEDVLIIGGRRLSAADVEALPPHVKEAGLAAARSLQQLPGLFNNLGGWLAGAASAINSVPVPRINTDALPNLPFLPQLLPNGTSNPLFNTLRTVTDTVQGALLNSTGCPIYCIDLRNQSWVEDGCFCNLERVKAAYPHVQHLFSQAIAATAALFCMMVASTWLLLHAASQWGRTRAEAKLLGRIPHAAQHALALQQGHSAGGGGGGSGGLAGGGGSKGGNASSSSGGGSKGEPSAPRHLRQAADDAAAARGFADVPAKQQPSPLASV